METSNYLINKVFTATAKDIVEMHGKVLTDYKPVLVIASQDHLIMGTDKRRQSALEKLVQNAQELKCEFVTDLKETVVKEVTDSAHIYYLGTGLVPK